ncbi:Sip1-related alpha-galactosidase [Haloferula chungangensis]|uniref:Sip1-related alpha-galactosidase n=1 Tax=Haloferula chungangensis TaxID=1048331 RepID=A0ABW2L8X6_9BACT
MKTLLTTITSSLVLASSLIGANPIVVSDKQSGFVVEKLTSTKPDKAGIVMTREIKLPEFKRGAYFRPFSGGVARGNRVEAVAFDSVEDLQSYKPSKTRKSHTNVQQGQFMLLELKDDRYLALLPMTSEEVYGQFFVEGGKLLLKSGNFGRDEVEGEVPLVIWAYGDSPYAATSSVWKQVFESGHVAAKPRSGKAFPEEPYGYLGWCSWEHYKRNISEKVITDATRSLEASEAPFRWVMVDDGYFTEMGRKLVSLDPLPKKFPNGWGPVTDLKNENGIKWIGIWRNMLGYMEGISPDHKMDDLRDDLVPGMVTTPKSLVKGAYLVPAETPEAAKALHDMMARDAVENGFDFTKVDFQTKAFDLYGGMGNAARASQYHNAALEEACKANGLPLLNCISQPNINSLQFSHSALTRSSPDYNQADKDKNKCNTYQSFANHLWLSQTVWGDLDMFHSHDERDVHPMAIARAISGGPVYISDEPSKIDADVLIPFAYVNGKLLRTSAPATLLPESFFIHPFRNDEVFRVVAPLEDGVAAIALFNFSESGKALTSGFKAPDYRHAGELLAEGRPWMPPSDGLLVYDRESRSVVDLGEGFTTEIPTFDARLYLLYPKTQDWAVIGRSDKYLPAAAVKVKSAGESELTFTLMESGPLLVWSGKEAPKMEGASFEPLGGGLYLAELPVEEGEREIRITR